MNSVKEAELRYRSMPESHPIIRLANAMCEAYGISQTAFSLGQDMKTRTAVESRALELIAALDKIGGKIMIVTP